MQFSRLLKLRSKLKLTLLISLSFFADKGFAQSKLPLSISDFSVSIHENAINKALQAIGKVSGKADYEVLFVKGKYTWTVLNAKLKLEENKAVFVADVEVDMGFTKYKNQIEGEVLVKYLTDKNLLQMNLQKTIFELHTDLFGRRIHLKDVNLADYYKEPFVFQGPASFQPETSFQMPDSTTKRLKTSLVNCTIKIIPQQILINSDLKITEVIKL